MKTIYFVTVILLLCIIFLTHPVYQMYPYLYLLSLIILICTSSYIVHKMIPVIESLQVSGESLQNVGSIYNSQKMVIKDLDVTGNLTINGELIGNNGTFKGNVKANIISGNLRHAHCGSYLSIQNNTCDESRELPDWHRYSSSDGGVSLGWMKRYGRIAS